MRKVYIKAYARENLGDDLFIRALVRRYKNTSFYLVAGKEYVEVFKEENNLKIFFVENENISNEEKKKKEHELKIEVMKMCDTYVYIGGSIFIEPVNKDYQKVYELRDEILSFENSYIIGSNFGPYESEEYYELIDKEIVANVTSITFRDKYSYNKFKERSNVYYAPDVVFSMDFEKIKTNTKNEIGISVIHHLERKVLKENYTKYQEKIVDTINYYAKQNYEIKLFSFCKYEKDELAINMILDSLDENIKDKVRVINYDGKIDKYLNEIASLEVFIATRFHAMILGLKLVDKVVPVCYSNKLRYVLDDLAFGGEYYDFENIDKLNYLNIKHSDIDIEKIEKLADDQFEELDKWLKKG